MPAPSASLSLDVGPTVVADIAPHPLTDEGRTTRVLALPRETTVADLVREQLGPGPQDVEVVLDGEWLPPERWARTPLRDGALVSVHPGVHGRNILSLVTIAASIFVPQLLGLSGLTSALVSGAIRIVGGIITNALFPVRPPDVGGTPPKPDPIYSLTGGANTARLYEPLALVLGTHRLFPDLGAKEYTEFVGDDQFLHQIFHAGLGDLVLSDYRIGATPIGDFSGVEIQLKRGGTITLVAGNVDTANGAALEDTDFVERTTGANTTRIGVDLVARLFELNDSGGFDARSVTVEIRYQKPGTAAVTRSVTLTHDKQSPLRRTLAYDLPEAGTWTVRVRRTSAPSDEDREYDEVTWAALRSYQPDPADYTGQTRLGMRIKASGQLTGRLDRFSVLASQRIPVYDADAGTWTDDHHASSNPAAVLRWYARGVAIAGSTRAGVGLAAERIDDALLGAWYGWCEAQGLACDTVLRGGATHDDTLTLIAQCGRAAVSWATGKLGVVYEDAERPASALVAPANILKGSFEVAYAQGVPADEVVVRYLEPELDWQYNSVRRTRPGLVGPPQTTATITARAVVVRANAARECNLQVARQHYHRRRLSWEMGREGRSLRKGHVVWITHSLIDGGFAGRLAALESTTRLKLDRAVNLTADDHLLLRLANGDLHQSAVTRPADVPARGEVDTVALTDALPDDALGRGEAIDVIWRLYDQALAPVKARIIAVEPRSDRRFKFTAIDEVAAYHQLATSDLSAPFPARPSRLPHVVSVQFVAERIRAGSGYVIQLDALLAVAGDWRGAVVRAGPDANTLALVDRLVDGDTTARWLVPPDTGQYVQIVPGTEAAQTGPVWTGTWMLESVPAPPPVTGFSVTHLADGHRIYAFTPPGVPDLAGVVIRYAADANADWPAMSAAHEGLITAAPYESVRPAAAGTYTFEARAVNTAGVESTGVRITVALPIVTGGLNWTGPWDASRTYALHDVVAHNGSSWVSLQDGNLNHEPAEGSAWWDLLVRQGTDGLPGARGLAGYAHAITRATRAAAFGDVDAATEWHLTGTPGEWAGTRTLRLGVVSADERALLERIAAGALVTVFDDAQNWADYRLVSAAFNTAAPLNARLSLTHLEHAGAQPASGAIAFHFTPAGADGLPGNRGLAGYSNRITRRYKRASASAAAQANEWYLTGSATIWSGNRTFTAGGLTEDEEGLLDGLSPGALVTLYQGAERWADYEVRSTVTFVGTGANRRADISLAYVESVGAQDASAAIALHFTRAGADGLPGNRGLAGYSHSIRRTHKRASASAAAQADEWYLTGEATTWSGARTFTAGGITEAEEAFLGRTDPGALVTLYQSPTAWADYHLVEDVTFVGTGADRRADLTLAFLERVGDQDATEPIELHFTASGANGIPGLRGLAGYAHSLSRRDKRATAAAASQANEWFLDGAADTWDGTRMFSAGGVTADEERALEGIGVGGLVTLYQGTGQWADYEVRSVVSFAGSSPNRRVDLALRMIESVGAQDATLAIALHFTPGAAAQPLLVKRLYRAPTTSPEGVIIPAVGGSRTWRYVTLPDDDTLDDYTAIELEAHGDHRGSVGAVSRAVDVGAIPLTTAAATTIDAKPAISRFSVGGETRAGRRVYMLSSRDADETLTLLLSRSADGRILYFAKESDRVFRLKQVLGLIGPVGAQAGTLGGYLSSTRTSTDSIYRRGTTPPATPSGGTTSENHLPSGWSRSEPQPSATENVYRSQRTRTFVNGAFQSATAWGAVTKVADATGTTTTATEYLYRAAASTPGAPAGGTATANHTPAGWTAPSPRTSSNYTSSTVRPTATLNVYRASRTVTLLNGAFQSATAWGAVTKVADATGATPPGAPTNLTFTRGSQLGNGRWPVTVRATLNSDLGTGTLLRTECEWQKQGESAWNGRANLPATFNQAASTTRTYRARTVTTDGTSGWYSEQYGVPA